MDEDTFTEALVAAIGNAELSRYLILPAGGLEAVRSHREVSIDAEAIARDLASPGGLKASHAQRRMLMVLVALWRPEAVEDLFGPGLSALAPAIMAMDRRNRAILAELIESFPGWGD